MNPGVGTHESEGVLDPSRQRVNSFTHSHSVQFYETDAFLLDQLAQFVGGALGAGNSAIVFATQTHLDALDDRLTDGGLNVSALKANDRLLCFEAHQVLERYTDQGWPDRERFAELVESLVGRARAASRNAKPRVVAFGELVAILQANEHTNEAVALEELWNELQRSYAFDLLCAYPLGNFAYAHDAACLTRICETHSEVFPAESYTSLDDANERLRAITELQQKAVALRNEAEIRKRIQQLLKRREADLSDFLENSLEGIVQIGPDCRIEWTNRAMLGMLGRSPEDCVGHRFDEFFADPARFDLFWRQLKRREPVYDFSVEFKHFDGVERSVVIHATGTWERNRFVHARCFVHDITDRALMARALEERNAELRRALAARDEFLTIAAHELKTPITGVRGFAQLLMRDVKNGRRITDERLVCALQTIDVETARLGRLVTRLLDASDARSGALKIDRRPTDLCALARAVAAQQETPVRHTIEVSAPEQLIVAVDPIHIEQVISNLVENAVRFSPTGGRVSLTLDRQNRMARIAVTDSGIGVPVEQRSHLFDPFYQAAAHQHLSGLGIGLFLTNEIVARHGGHIEVEDPEQGGSRFVVYLPDDLADPGPCQA